MELQQGEPNKNLQQLHHDYDGLWTAIVSPFRKAQIDFLALDKIINHQIEGGVRGIVVAGSTGEGFSLNSEEYESLLERSVTFSAKRLLVVAGVTDVSYHGVLFKTKVAHRARVDAIMCAIPPYIKPNRSGIMNYFQALHEASTLPIILYSVPSRTNVDFAEEDLHNLFELPNVIGFKDASGDVQRAERLISSINKPFAYFCGDDELLLPFSRVGANGLMSVASNVIPAQMQKMAMAIRDNDFNRATYLDGELRAVYDALNLDTNPVCVKYLMFLLKLCNADLRHPLAQPNEETRKVLYEMARKIRAKNTACT
ncbi:4-hydroxy-tetrahydrodipicolinate synthase [Rickettsiales endosymbiont of Paramecium tredecaurelia]|uniref:4-hydroxy-tetrahydrodipicolinate synthase n=1 Tax=Candidatus Sarmatiella mevalonica TaxID=2770581 RepID=UPI001924C3F5|nr:4-hydroxy-tetrahydrodipicolinate synthase [Candidatus Sarmatiella mevalonica]MBL3285173.1 4-hydroxy-tetrahydrodipicolinate synthase [Candidatus Sarmatiella mevalonica]